MIAAVYARKSTDQGGVADEAKSVTRQIDHARAYAARKGWTVDDAHVYVDDGISGAEFAARPGFVRLMNALKPQRAVSGARHVGGVAPRPRGDRDALRAEAADAGWRPRVLLPGGPRADARLPHRQAADVGDRVRRRARAREGAAANVRRHGPQGAGRPGDRRPRVRVRQRRRCTDANGRSAHTSSGASTRPRPPSCVASSSCALRATASDGSRSAQRRRRAGATAAASAAERLDAVVCPARCSTGRSIAARLVWNAPVSGTAGGSITSSRGPEREWLRIPAPELRIVDEALWTAAHARLANARALYLERNGGRPGAGPSRALCRSTC